MVNQMSSADQRIHTMENLSNRMAEESVIGGLMLNPESDGALYAIERLKPKDFYFRDCATAWQAITDMSAMSKQIDLLTVSAWIEANHLGLEFSQLGAMAKSTPSQANIRAYTDIVKGKAMMRQALAAIHNASDVLYGPGDDSEKIARAMDFISDFGQDDSAQDVKDPVDVMHVVYDMMGRALKSKTGMVGISSGFENIDRMTNGFQAPDLIVVAAPPSMGKTTFSLNFAEYAAFLDPNPKNVLVFSLEMSAEQLMQKTISNLGNIYLNKIKTGQALGDDLGLALFSGAQRIIMERRKHFRIDDKGGQSIGEIQSRAKRTALKMGGLDLIVVDYLHKIEAPGETDIQVISNALKGLKNLAKQLNCPVILLSQLNRGFTGRPEMKNLLGSSKIEQDADIIMFLYDEDYQKQRGDHSLTEIIFAKNRMGETGSTFLQPELAMSRFRDTQRLPSPKAEEPAPYKKRQRFDQ